MSFYPLSYRVSNFLTGAYKSILFGRSNITQIQICTKKTAEAKLGIDKPKRPLTPFFKFMSQMRPALLSKNPGISSKEAISWSSKHWQQLDAETKQQMTKEYEKDLEDYKKIKELYENSLTEQQKSDIQRVKEEMNVAKEKRKLKAEYKELGRPKKPMSSYFLFAQMKKDSFKATNLKEFQAKLKADWQKLSETERNKYDKQAQDLMAKYKKDLEAWELKMISLGRTDVLRIKPVKEKKPKVAKKEQ